MGMGVLNGEARNGATILHRRVNGTGHLILHHKCINNITKVDGLVPRKLLLEDPGRLQK